MGVGLLLGTLIPNLNDWLDTVKVGSVSLPIVIGLLAMMYPVLAKVKYSHIGEIAADREILVNSLILNWLIGPLLMFTLAWLMLPDLPEYRTGLIIIGLARCIAMVLIWNDIACGHREAAAVLVAINSVFQIVAYSLLGYFYLELLLDWLGLDTASLDVSMWEIGKRTTMRATAVLEGMDGAAADALERLIRLPRGEDWPVFQILAVL